ncbi:cytochrome P450 [Microtetraspora malaysiensis]|uniref:cytochrome P450 n=1 Tax=Microtetraspora malaysiensis TaxID=161358 RepID=UPI000ABC6F85|nr:cytochrome P450 [Microtetraspora malaysiensis]
MAAATSPRFEGGQWVISRYADACAVLSDDRFAVPEAPPGGTGIETGIETGMGWLRGAVSRFANGRRHAEGRRAAVAALAPLDPVRLREAARRRAGTALRDGVPFDAVARRIPVAVLADVLCGDSGSDPDEVADLVGVIADAYFPGTGPDAPADAALDRLLCLIALAPLARLGAPSVDVFPRRSESLVPRSPLAPRSRHRRAPRGVARSSVQTPPRPSRVSGWRWLAPGRPEAGTLATTVMLLVQACDSTAGLIRNAARHLTGRPDPATIDELLEETLRLDPPLKVLRRVTTERVTLGDVVVEAGTAVVIDVPAAGRDAAVPSTRPPGAAHLTFGHGLRPCPGDRLALSLAAGVLEAVADSRHTAGTPGARAFALFREMHHGPAPLVLPNAWDYASAAALARAGFTAVGTTSLGVAAVAGKPDGEGATRDETVALARRLARLPCLVSVDIEGGFGGTPGQVADLAAELAAFGVVGVNLEDGRPGGRLAPLAAVQEAVAAIKERVPGMFVNARTDTFWLATTLTGDEAGTAEDRLRPGERTAGEESRLRPEDRVAGKEPSGAEMLDEALRRCRAYAEAGADGVFVPGVAEAEHIRALAGGTGVPLNVLFLPAGPTVAGLAELGVRRISCGSLLYRAALGAAVTTALAVAEGGPVATGLPGYAEVQALLKG